MHVKAGLHGQPVRKGPDPTRAPATDRVELGARLRDLRERPMSYRRQLTDPVVESLREVLILGAGRGVLHALNYTKHMFAYSAFYRPYISSIPHPPEFAKMNLSIRRRRRRNR